MKLDFLQAVNGRFEFRQQPIMLRGYALGCWQNLEHFMVGLPTNQDALNRALTATYGEKNTALFINQLQFNLINASDFAFLKSLGINCLRLVLRYEAFENRLKPGDYSEAAFAELDRVLALCREFKLYAILDMHSSPAGQNPDGHSGSTSGVSEFWDHAGLQQVFTNLWRTLAHRYRNETIIAGYDLLNEPAFVPSKTVFNIFYRSLITAIREVDDNHILFLEGDHWAQDLTIFNPIDQPQLAWSFHFYPAQHISPYLQQDQITEQLRNKLSIYLQLRETTGYPLWVGETGGLFPSTRRQLGFNLVEQTLAFFNREAISWSLWTYKDANAMGLVYPRKQSPWMRWTKDMARAWKPKSRRTETLGTVLLNNLAEQLDYSLTPAHQEKLQFRISALIYELHAEYTVLPQLRKTCFEHLLEYTQSFLLENSEISKTQRNLLTRILC